MRRPPRHHVRSESPHHSSGSGSSPALSNSSSSSPAPQSSTPSPQESPKNCSYIYRDWLQFNTTPPSLMNHSSSPIVNQLCQPNVKSLTTTPSMSRSSTKSNAKTLQPKKSSSSPLSKIKFHSISKRRQSGQNLNMNEKFQLIKKHGTSSSSFIGSDDYDYINYGTNTDKSSCSGGKSSSLKKYFLKFAGDKVDSNSLEAKNLFHLKRHHYPTRMTGTKASISDDNDFDVLDF